MAKKRSDEDKRTILKEARGRFTRCQNWESTARARYVDDVKFSEGDSDNLYQWPEDIRSRMSDDKRAMLTINKTNQHILDVLNDARQARVAIKIRPTGDGATVDAAEIFMGVIRHIEYLSNASTSYQHGLACSTRGGIGYWRLATGYANDDSFDQEIFIRRVRDPLTIYLDPEIQEFDGSDAKFGFVFTELVKDDHPELKDVLGNSDFGPTSWVKENSIRQAEYFRRVEHKERLIAYPDPADKSGESMKVVRESALDPQMVKMLVKMTSTQVRTIKTHKVEWFKIIGDTITEENEWPGIYIPIVRCVGEETVIDGELDRKGLTRALKDPQRMFNYNASGSVEFGALQSKSPWVAPADAIEGYETYWNNANTDNFSVLPWNHMDDEGTAIPSPQRQNPPSSAPVFIEGMNASAEWMRMVSGQYQADMGAPSNERSGAAITARQRQGDNATFHFLDHQSMAIRFTGKQLVDLIPKIYDTPRILEILSEAGDRKKIRLDVSAEQALQKTQQDRDEVEAIFNPRVGKYEVIADVGPAFATRRQEAWNAYVQILTQNKELVGVIGDLAFKMADFPGAEEVATRLKRMVPQKALEDGPSPDLLAAQQQIEALQALVKQVAQKLADKTAEHLNDQEKNAVSAYDAQTKRLSALKEALITDPDGLMDLVRQVIAEAQATSGAGLGPALEPNAELTAEAMMPPAQPPQPALPPGGPAGPGLGAPPPNINPGDMGAGPAPQPGAGPMGGAEGGA